MARLVVCLVAALAAVLVVAPASAAGTTPVRGGRYVDGEIGGYSVRLVVSRNGRSLSPRRSRFYGCAGQVRIGTSTRPVRIRRDGIFRLVQRRGKFALHIRGRFQSKDLAHVTLRYLRVPGRKGHPCDDSGRVRFAPRRVHQIPFHDCATHKANTLLTGPSGRIFQQLEWHDGIWETVAYACLFSANKRMYLSVDDPNSDDADLDLFRLAGPYVAYRLTSSEGAAGSVNVVVEDLRNGKTNTPGDVPTDIELKDDGSVAWIGAESQLYGQPRSVWADDTAGHRQLDSGNGIVLDSLELNGSTLTWVKNGTVRSATLQ